MRYLLLLSLILGLVACVKSPPKPEDLPTRAAAATTVPTIVKRQVSSTDSSTPSPTVNYQGVTMAYSDQLLGVSLESRHELSKVDNLGNVLPENISFSFAGSELFKTPELRVFPAAHYKASSAEASSHLSMLASILRDQPVQPTAPLPLFPLPETISTFEHLPTYVNFENGIGISFLAQIEQDSGQQIFYIFQGITDDQEYYVTALLPLNTADSTTVNSAASEETYAQIANREDLLKLELGDTQNILSDSFHSLRIEPRSEFPSPAPAAYISYPGVLLAYDPDLSGEAAVEKTPPVFVSSTGSSLFLPGLPDAIQIAFNNEGLENDPILKIQPVRGATGQFFPSIPSEQQQLVQMLETSAKENMDPDASQDAEGLERWLSFHSGYGFRQVVESTPAGDTDQTLHIYQYKGITEDGRYLIEFHHPIQIQGSQESDLENAAGYQTILSQLDQMIQSLDIAPDASTDSSIPVNSPDCTLDAQFVKDITIPDQTVVERGEAFTKTWRVRNTGTCSWTPAYQIKIAGGNPLSWSNLKLLDVVPAGEETEISVEIISPEIPGKYQAWWQLSDEMGIQFGTFFYVLFEAPKPATDIPGYGVIQGEIGYPAGDIPGMTIYFMRTDGSQRFALDTEDGWNNYANELPVGNYYIFARVAGDQSDSGGGYTAGVLCGLNCKDHTLVEVRIEEGKVTNDINVIDWYAPAGTFPLP